MKFFKLLNLVIVLLVFCLMPNQTNATSPLPISSFEKLMSLPILDTNPEIFQDANGKYFDVNQPGQQPSKTLEEKYENLSIVTNCVVTTDNIRLYFDANTLDAKIKDFYAIYFNH